MRLSFSFRSEDVLIYSIVTFALLYPLIVALLIWYEGKQKESFYRELLLPFTNVILGKDDCKKVYQMKDRLGDTFSLRDMEYMCQRNRNAQIEREHLNIQSGKDTDKILYTVVFRKDKKRYQLSVKALSDGESFKVVSVDLK